MQNLTPIFLQQISII